MLFFQRPLHAFIVCSCHIITSQTKLTFSRTLATPAYTYHPKPQVVANLSGTESSLMAFLGRISTNYPANRQHEWKKKQGGGKACLCNLNNFSNAG